MTRKEASKLWQIIKAYGEGKTIQWRHSDTEWEDCYDFEFEYLEEDYCQENDVIYRIKPEVTETNSKADFLCNLFGALAATALKVKESNQQENLKENFVYKHGDKFVIMDVKLPLIKDPPLYEGSLEECNKWIDEQVKEPTCTRDDVLMAEEVEGNYTIEQNCGENRVEGGVLGVSGSVSEKKYRPFKDCNELVECWEKKLFTPAVMFTEDTRNKLYRPSIWVKSKEYGTDFLITAFDNNNESIGANVIINDMGVTMKMLFDNYIFCDNSVCGVEE